MHSTYGNHRLLTPGGECHLCGLGQFISHIFQKLVNPSSEFVKVPKPVERPTIERELAQLNSIPTRESFTVEEVRFKEIVSSHEMVSNTNDFIEKKLMQFLNKEFINMLANKEPDFMANEGKLTLDLINKMALRYAEQFGGDPMYGITLYLSKYQKFFSIACPKDFHFYKRERIDKDTIEGALYTPHDQRWILTPYQEETYKEELLVPPIG